MTRPRSRPLAVATAGIVGTLLLGACAGSPATANPSAAAAGAPALAAPTSASAAAVATTPAAPPAGADACALVTEQDAATALGADPGPGTPFTSHGSSQCQYGEAPAFLLVNLNPSGGKAAYAQERAGMGARGQLVDVLDVGDTAFGVFKGPVASVAFNKGDALVVIVLTIGRSSTAPPRDQAIALAKTAAGRM